MCNFNETMQTILFSVDFLVSYFEASQIDSGTAKKGRLNIKMKKKQKSRDRKKNIKIEKSKKVEVAKKNIKTEKTVKVEVAKKTKSAKNVKNAKKNQEPYKSRLRKRPVKFEDFV